jgi:aldehyde dehydrogenase (NAD+)
MSRYKHYVGGRWLDGDGTRTLEIVNPASEETFARLQAASVAQAREAIHAARRAFDEGPWPRMAPRERSRMLFQLADELRPYLDSLRLLHGATRDMRVGRNSANGANGELVQRHSLIFGCSCWQAQ